MRKRERENPCDVCGHYHKYEEGEVCGVCGHRVPAASERAIHQSSAFPSEILKDFLYLGSYDNASRGEILKAIGVTHILNTVPACQNLYKNSFTYYCLQDDKILQFDEAMQFLEQCDKEKARVLVHCMLGKNRSPAIVIGYLMKSKGWRLAQSSQWVKDRRPVMELSSAVCQQLLEYEQKLFGTNEGMPVQPIFPPESVPSFGFGFPTSANVSPAPMFNQPTTASIFERTSLNTSGSDFVFGAERNLEQRMMENPAFVFQPNGSEAPMDSS
ncbi:protein-tyrosine-phosphatase IBR5-like [Canna indica]|uniref:Protein-tyrosine-phosphatase IBR5-like n=1 Tax=Canna indica TaxID=4628 RepID=A0AAQ3JQD8_9LILI|nr:protein-tyrosine-phosphatase IBR5-like [Canna indica]